MNFYLAVFTLVFVAYPWHGVATGSKNAKSKLDLENLSNEEINKLLDSILEKRNKERDNSIQTCIEDYEEKPNVIIRTRDSLNRGATFIKAPKEVETLEECKMKCCNTLDGDVPCDLAVFQSIDDDPEDNQPKCFLFSCVDGKGKYVCVTSSNSNYSVYRRKGIPETELLDVASSTTGTSAVLPVSTSHSTTSSTTVPIISTYHVTSELITFPVTITTTTESVQSKPSSTEAKHRDKVPESTCKKDCSRLEWQCDDGCCIKVTEVCDKSPDCKDSSDESICDAVVSHNEKHGNKSSSTTSTKLTETSTTTAIPSMTENDVKETTELQKQENPNSDNKFVSEKVQAQRSAILPLALGLAVLLCILLMVICRVQIMKRRLRRNGKPLSMEESDYLINGMYL